MDEALEKALEFSNYTTTLNTQRRILKEKYKEDIILYYQGGKFTVTQEFFSFISSLKMHSDNKTVVIDDNELPIEIKDLDEFFELVKQQYTEATNNYLASNNELIKQRSVSGLIND
jgi:hypothetical protein